MRKKDLKVKGRLQRHCTVVLPPLLLAFFCFFVLAFLFRFSLLLEVRSHGDRLQHGIVEQCVGCAVRWGSQRRVRSKPPRNDDKSTHAHMHVMQINNTLVRKKNSSQENESATDTEIAKRKREYRTQNEVVSEGNRRVKKKTCTRVLFFSAPFFFLIFASL